MSWTKVVFGIGSSLAGPKATGKPYLAARSLAGRTPPDVRAGGSHPSGGRRQLPVSVALQVRGNPVRGLRMQLTMNHASTGAARAEALFASVSQRSDRPSPGQVR